MDSDLLDPDRPNSTRAVDSSVVIWIYLVKIYTEYESHLITHSTVNGSL